MDISRVDNFDISTIINRLDKILMENSEDSYLPRYEQIAQINNIEIPDYFEDKIMQYLLDPNTFYKLEEILLQIFNKSDAKVLSEFISAISKYISEALDDFMIVVNHEHNGSMTQTFMSPIYELFIQFQRSKHI